MIKVKKHGVKMTYSKRNPIAQEVRTEKYKPKVVPDKHKERKDGDSGWHSIEDIQKEKLAICYSVGWLILKNDERTVVMADYSNEENANDGGRHIAIPSGWVKSITYLKYDYRERI